MAQEMRNSVLLWDRPVQGRAVEGVVDLWCSHVFAKVASCFLVAPGGRNVMSSNDQATRKSGSSLSASLS